MSKTVHRTACVDALSVGLADGGMPEGGRSAGNSCGCAREEVVVWSTTIRGIVLPPEDEVRGALCGRVVKDVFDVFDDRVGL
jgi:hypothetical protein